MATALSILLVDDSRLILTKLGNEVASMPGVEKVLKAATYEAAVEFLQKETVHVLLLDINLKGRSGIELLEYVRVQHPAVKTIMVTNQGNDYYRNICQNLGSIGFIDKSHELDLLPDLISNCAA